MAEPLAPKEVDSLKELVISNMYEIEKLVEEGGGERVLIKNFERSILRRLALEELQKLPDHQLSESS